MTKTIKGFLAALGMSLMFSGCQTPVIEVQSVVIDKENVDVTRDGTVQLTATVSPENATDNEVVWRSSDNGIATVSSTGLVTGVAVGTATISATAGGQAAMCRVNVTDKVTEAISIEPASVSIARKEEYSLKVKFTPEDSDQRTVEWSSSDTTIVKVDNSGWITGCGIGEATITAVCGEASATASVTVTPIQMQSLSLGPQNADVIIGGYIKMRTTISPEDADWDVMDWSSSDETVATVDETGRVHALGTGTATISCRFGELEANCTLSVVEPGASVGDYYYSDGTWSGTLDPDKEVIGIVYYVGQHENDFSDYSATGIGKTRCNGYVMALADAFADYCYWGPEDQSDLECYPVDNHGERVDNYSNNGGDNDWSGYDYTRKIVAAAEANGGPGPDRAATYPAIYYTLAYGDMVKAPSSSSGWFLPAVSQLWSLNQNKGLLSKAGAELPDEWYWSSSEDFYAYDIAIVVDSGGNRILDNYKETMASKVRCVLAF